ncbi:MAG: hypothetical protein QOJ80_2422 [Mycobacterium sp.]|nr:hypothetical protein [Mycobacterium sp.]
MNHRLEGIADVTCAGAGYPALAQKFGTQKFAPPGPALALPPGTYAPAPPGPAFAPAPGTTAPAPSGPAWAPAPGTVAPAPSGPAVASVPGAPALAPSGPAVAQAGVPSTPHGGGGLAPARGAKAMAVAPAPAKRICVMSCFLMCDGYHPSICSKHPNSGETHVEPAIEGAALAGAAGQEGLIAESVRRRSRRRCTTTPATTMNTAEISDRKIAWC